MADAVTYADLKFSENSARETRLSDAAEDNDPSDVTYENFTRPQKDKEAPTAPPEGTSWNHQLRAKLQKSSSLLVLILLSLCLILLAVSIVMTIKYISVSDESQLLQSLQKDLETNSQELRRSQEELGRSQEELGRSQEEMGRSKEELKKNQEEVKKSRQIFAQVTGDLKCSVQEAENKVKDLQAKYDRAIKEQQEAENKQYEAENKRNDTETILNFTQKELCPQDWSLFGRRCLWFPQSSMKWSGCDDFCGEMESNLLVVKEEDTELKTLLGGKKTDYWVGKEVRNRKWDWPSDYKIDKSHSWICAKVKAGKLDKENCYEYNKCVCERRLL